MSSRNDSVAAWTCTYVCLGLRVRVRFGVRLRFGFGRWVTLQFMISEVEKRFHGCTYLALFSFSFSLGNRGARLCLGFRFGLLRDQLMLEPQSAVAGRSRTFVTVVPGCVLVSVSVCLEISLHPLRNACQSDRTLLLIGYAPL